MNFILFDDSERSNLLPFAFTRPVADFRTGILTIREGWERRLEKMTSTSTESWLSTRFPLRPGQDEMNIWINGSILPSDSLVAQIKNLRPMQALMNDDVLLAANTGAECDRDLLFDSRRFTSEMAVVRITEPVLRIARIWDIFSLADKAITSDYALLTSGRTSQPLSETNRVVGKHPVFLEPGARIECCIINTEAGPVYIGANALVMEGSMLRGPLAVCENAVIKMGAKIYSGSVIGPGCKVGGEVQNSVFFANSNKSHDGYLGNSVIGEWCNLGADTNNSNLKNNYGPVKVWNYATEQSENSGLIFCGLFMGDHSKCGINTMFNTGTVVGVMSNVFGGGFPPTFIPDFSWGGAEGFSDHRPEKAFETAERVMLRRNLSFSTEEKDILAHTYAHTASLRLPSGDLLPE